MSIFCQISLEKLSVVIYLHTDMSLTGSIICFADKFVSTLEVISEEQESITSSPQSVSDTSADEQVKDSQFDETPNDNPEQASDTVLIAPSGNDFKINIIDVQCCEIGRAHV